MIFVFGSNLRGYHGAGAAAHAMEFEGAKDGCGHGRSGNSYAIPTKDKKLQPLSLKDISGYVSIFCYYAREHSQTPFLMTPIGCGYAGHNPEDILSLFKQHNLPNNVFLSNTWKDHF